MLDARRLTLDFPMQRYLNSEDRIFVLEKDRDITKTLFVISH